MWSCEENALKRAKKRAISRLRNTFKPLQNRGSRVRVLPPLPRKKPNAIALGFFQRCLPLQASYVDFISDVHFVSDVTPYGVVGKHLITATKGSYITMRSISSLRQSRNLTHILIPSSSLCDNNSI